jgi:hypothetical protein
MVFYRYDQIEFEDGPRLSETTFGLIKETPYGWWIGHSPDECVPVGPGKWWVSKTARKRFAYPTKKEALENFMARKRRQIAILNYKLERAAEAWDLAEAKLKELS